MELGQQRYYNIHTWLTESRPLPEAEPYRGVREHLDFMIVISDWVNSKYSSDGFTEDGELTGKQCNALEEVIERILVRLYNRNKRVYTGWIDYRHIYEVFVSHFNGTTRSFAEWIQASEGNDYDYLIHMFVDAYVGKLRGEA